MPLILLVFNSFFRKFVPSSRDVLNWYRAHEVSDRILLGKTAFVEKLMKLKVIESFITSALHCNALI